MTRPTVTVDLAHRMLAVRLRNAAIAYTDQLDDAHIVDLDAEGRVVSLDIMTLDDFKIDEMADGSASSSRHGPSMTGSRRW